MSVDAPRVTVVIANYNYGHWLQDAILSAVNDPWPNKHIVVSDDGSTDDSLPKAFELMAAEPGNGVPCSEGVGRGVVAGTNVPYSILHSSVATGPSAARNRALKYSWDFSDCFAVLDADDMFLPGKLAATVPKLADANICAVYTDYDILSTTSGVKTREYKIAYSRALLVRDCHIHSACVISKAALEKVGLYNKTFRVCEDYELWLRLSRHFIFSHVPQCLMVVRSGEYNSTNTVPTASWQESWARIQKGIQEGEL